MRIETPHGRITGSLPGKDTLSIVVQQSGEELRIAVSLGVGAGVDAKHFDRADAGYAEGAAWAAAPSGTTETLNAVASAGDSTAWAVGSNGVTLHSSDGGRTWSPAPPAGRNTLFALDLVNPNRGVAVGRRGATARLP